MRQHIRSLQALVFFEAAGRLRSLKLAAAELHVTPSAVSRQIRALEDDLGVQLFRRLARGIELTDEGTAYLQYDNAQLLLEAAAAGQGVALASRVIADRYLSGRRLIAPFDINAASAVTYHLVARPGDLDKPAIRAFRSWIHAEMDGWQTEAVATPRLRQTQPSLRKNRLSAPNRRR